MNVWVLMFWSPHLTGTADFFERDQCLAARDALRPQYEAVCVPRGRPIDKREVDRDWDWFLSMYGGRVLSLDRGAPSPSVTIRVPEEDKK